MSDTGDHRAILAGATFSDESFTAGSGRRSWAESTLVAGVDKPSLLCSRNYLRYLSDLGLVLGEPMLVFRPSRLIAVAVTQGVVDDWKSEGKELDHQGSLPGSAQTSCLLCPSKTGKREASINHRQSQRCASLREQSQHGNSMPTPTTVPPLEHA